LESAPVKLLLRFDKHEAKRLAEAPISTDQTISPIDDHWVRITATVDDTVQMRRWIKSLGALVVIEGPPYLIRQQIFDLHAQIKQYSAGD
jgi:hypothetical protein